MDGQAMNLTQLDIKIVRKLLEINRPESSTKLAELLFENPSDYALKIKDNLVRAHAKKLHKYGVLNVEQNYNITRYKINTEIVKKDKTNTRIIVNNSGNEEPYTIIW
jgi:hypothetical protein